MLNNLCFHVYAQKWHMSNVKCQVSNVKCQVSNVNCLCWSLGHAEQLLFSCLCSKVAYVKCQVSSVKCQMLMLILGTCWTTFVFMSMLKSDIYQMSSIKCQMLMLILGTCRTTFVFMCIAKKWVFVIMSHVTFRMSRVWFLAGNPALWTQMSVDWVMWSKKTSLQILPKTVTLEHRHENKSCSACPEDHF